MDLHRARAKSEWAYIDPSEHNRWQKIAARTNGVVTPGNAVSTAGAAAVAKGLFDVAKGKTFKGFMEIGVGRYADILDGKVAAKTGTKSPIGEGVDAVTDKIELGIALPVLVSKDVISKTTFGVILGLNVANAGASIVAKRRHNEIHPSKAGKLATFGQWLAVGLYGLAAASRQHNANNLAHGLEVAGTISLVASTGLGVVALKGYVKDAFAEPSNIEADHSEEANQAVTTDPTEIFG